MFKLRMFLIGFAILFSSSLALSAGLELPVNGTARTKGSGGAGLATINDSSSILINPAGLAYVEGTQLQGGFGALFATVEYTPPGLPKENNDFKLIPLPNGGFATDKFAPFYLGFFSYPAFGKMNEFDGPSLFQTMGATTADQVRVASVYRAKLLVAEGAPAIAVKLSDDLALGFALRFAWVYLERDSHILLVPGTESARTDEEYHGFYQSWRLGAQWHPTTDDWLNNLHVGLVFRMLAQTDVHGIFRVRNFIGPLPSAAFSPWEVEADTLLVDIPLNVGLGFTYDIAPEWRAMVDTFYTNWNNTNDIRFLYQQPLFGSLIDSVTRLAMKDSFKIHTGTEFDMNDWLTLRGGYTFDMRAVGDLALNRVIYDGDTHVFAVGSGLYFKNPPLVGDLFKQIDLDLAFEFGFGERFTANNGANLQPGYYDIQGYNMEFLFTAHM
ncbi:OmpP1/FadL family transporter [Bdellovibrionota bacterium]